MLMDNMIAYAEIDEILNLLEDKMHSNEVQISILENMRDTLLPKLISGEVRLKGFETLLQA